MTAWTKDVYSSNLASVSYDVDTQDMIVAFRKGGRYAYPDVSEEKALQLANAPSAGSLFHAEFKQLPFRKL
jgi:hypothetical protein